MPSSFFLLTNERSILEINSAFDIIIHIRSLWKYSNEKLSDSLKSFVLLSRSRIFYFSSNNVLRISWQRSEICLQKILDGPWTPFSLVRFLFWVTQSSRHFSFRSDSLVFWANEESSVLTQPGSNHFNEHYQVFTNPKPTAHSKHFHNKVEYYKKEHRLCCIGV